MTQSTMRMRLCVESRSRKSGIESRVLCARPKQKEESGRRRSSAANKTEEIETKIKKLKFAKRGETSFVVESSIQGSLRASGILCRHSSRHAHDVCLLNFGIASACSMTVSDKVLLSNM